jgi:adenylate kinase family enzyme
LNKTIAFLLGPPGGGKGTAAKKLHEAGFQGFVMSDELKLLMDKEPDKATAIKTCMDGGLYVPDSIILPVMRKVTDGMEHQAPHLLTLDGIRTFRQAQLILAWLKQHEYTIFAFDITFDPPDLRICEERMIKRGRQEETPDVMATRFDEYRTYHPGVAELLKWELEKRYVGISGLLEPEQKFEKMWRTMFGEIAFCPPHIADPPSAPVTPT